MIQAEPHPFVVAWQVFFCKTLNHHSEWTMPFWANNLPQFGIYWWNLFWDAKVLIHQCTGFSGSIFHIFSALKDFSIYLIRHLEKQPVVHQRGSKSVNIPIRNTANDHTSPIWKTHGKTLKGNAGSPISNILWGLRLSPERTSWQLWMTLKFHTLDSTKTKTAKKIIKVIRFMSQCEPATELTTWHSQLKMFACKSLLDRNPFFSARQGNHTPNTQLVPAAVFEALSPAIVKPTLWGKTRDAQKVLTTEATNLSLRCPKSYQ